VVWAQEHLISAGRSLGADGNYTSTTEQAVRDFQTANALLVTGQIDTPTWNALLRYEASAPDWGKAAARAARAGSRPNGPRSARLPARRDELRGATASRARSGVR
jgi:peptidoglycan hydrolase-like protein with peptidoglycan-binding domain